MSLSDTQVLQIIEPAVEAARESFHAGDYAGALDRCERVLEEDPAHEEALYYRGVSLFRLGRLHEAKDSFDRLLELHPSHYKALSYRTLVDEKMVEREQPREPAPAPSHPRSARFSRLRRWVAIQR